MEFSVKDSFRTAIELASGGKNTVIYDNQGNPNIMVCIPKFDKSLLGLSAGIHGAFVLDDNHVAGEIWVSKYANGEGSGGVPVSMHELLPSPKYNRGFENVKELIRSKGSGWHVMSNIEWAAIAALSVKQGTEPYGFTYRSSSFKKYLCTKHKPFDGPYNGTLWNVRAGHSLNEFSHDGTADGIFDMVGNVWEFVDGMRLTNASKGGTTYFGEDGVPQNRFRDGKMTHGDWYIGADESGPYFDTASETKTKGTIVWQGNNVRYLNKSGDYKEQIYELGLMPITETKYPLTYFINLGYTSKHTETTFARGGCAWKHDDDLVDYSIYSIDTLAPVTDKDCDEVPELHAEGLPFATYGVRACYISDLY